MATRIQIAGDAGLLWSVAIDMGHSPAPVSPPPAKNESQWDWPTLPVPMASRKEVAAQARAIQTASELKLLEASNLYKLAKRARDVPTKIENISLAQRCIEEGIAIAEPQLQIKHALIAKKAHIQLDLLKDADLEYLHVDYPLLSRRFPIIRMSVDEIEDMVTTAHDEFKRLTLQSHQLSKEFASLALRIEAARTPVIVSDPIEAEPIEQELEEDVVEALLMDATEVLAPVVEMPVAEPVFLSKRTEERQIQVKKSGKLTEAKKFYAAAMRATEISLIARNISLSLKNSEEGLKIGSSTSKTQYSLIEKKAQNYLKIFENAILHQFLIHEPDLIKRYQFTEMTLDEIEVMVKDAHDSLENMSLRFKKSKYYQNKIGDFKDLLKRIGDIRKRAQEKEEPIVPNLEDKTQEAALSGDRVMPVEQAQPIAKKILKQVNDLYWAVSSWTDELEKKSKLQASLDAIEEGLKDPDIQITEKAALLLRKSQIQFDLGKNRSMIKRQIKAMQMEIDDAEFKKTPWSTIYSFNHLLDRIKEEQRSRPESKGIKRKSDKEIIDPLRLPKKAKR